MSLVIPQKKTKGGTGEENTSVELASLMVPVALLTVSILLLKHLGKMTAFGALKVKITVLGKVGSGFLLGQIVNKLESQAQFALQTVYILVI